MRLKGGPALATSPVSQIYKVIEFIPHFIIIWFRMILIAFKHLTETRNFLIGWGVDMVEHIII